jgi:predicted RNA binding protein YcfA (HicA-like mRNA interferase family)
MTKAAKLLDQLGSVPPDMRYADLRKLLESLGWGIRESGSHVIVTSPRGYNITLARTPEKVKRSYLRMVLEEHKRCEIE